MTLRSRYPFSRRAPAFTVIASALLIVGAAPAERAAAGQGPWSGPEMAQVRLISAGVTPGAPAFWAALEFRMEPGWKIYWRNPGAAGRPPVANWSASRGVEVGAFNWPRPRIFAFSGIATAGYGRRVLLPVRSTLVKRSGKDATSQPSIVVDVIYQTCKHICIPVRARLQLSGAGLLLPDSGIKREIATSLSKVPAALSVAVVDRLPAGGWRVFVRRPSGINWGMPKLVIEAGTKSRIGLRPTEITSSGLVFTIEKPPLSPNAAPLRYLLVDGDWAGGGRLEFR